MERKCKIITIALFMIILCGVGLFTVLGGGKKYSVFEKRELAPFPKTNVKTITKAKFQSGLDNFLNDHVVFRDQCIYTTTMVDKMMGRAEKADVYFGKDGYLIEKSIKATHKKIKENVDYLSTFVNMAADSMGSKNVKVVLIPNKENVLTDKMPKYAPVSDDNIKMKAMLWESLKDKKMLVDLTKPLQQHKDEYIYYKTDHHWTSLGAKYGFQEMMKSLKQKIHKRTPKVVTDQFLGTTYNKIHYATQKDIITRYDEDEGLPKDTCGVDTETTGEKRELKDIYDKGALKREDKYEYFMGGNYGIASIHSHNTTNGKTLVLIKDSFANCMVPFLTDNYEEIIMIDPRYLGGSIMEALSNVEKIDTMIVLFNEEKFMNNTDLWTLG